MTIESRNGQQWRPAFVVTGLGADSPQTSEIEDRGVVDGTFVDVSASVLNLPVPVGAPVSGLLDEFPGHAVDLSG